jgi:hypothetical protein
VLTPWPAPTRNQPRLITAPPHHQDRHDRAFAAAGAPVSGGAPATARAPPGSPIMTTNPQCRDPAAPRRTSESVTVPSSTTARSSAPERPCARSLVIGRRLRDMDSGRSDPGVRCALFAVPREAYTESVAPDPGSCRHQIGSRVPEFFSCTNRGRPGAGQKDGESRREMAPTAICSAKTDNRAREIRH